jgi:hypothetical protein
MKSESCKDKLDFKNFMSKGIALFSMQVRLLELLKDPKIKGFRIRGFHGLR